MPKRLQFARPMMRCRAGLHTNEARRHFLEERQDVATLQLTAEDHLAIGVNAVHLKTRLGDVETDCLNCLHVWLLSIVGGLNSTHFHGTRAPVEEPSTASKADICSAPGDVRFGPIADMEPKSSASRRLTIMDASGTSNRKPRTPGQFRRSLSAAPRTGS